MYISKIKKISFINYNYKNYSNQLGAELIINFI